MELSTLFALKEKYAHELVYAEARVSVINDLIAQEEVFLSQENETIEPTEQISENQQIY